MEIVGLELELEEIDLEAEELEELELEDVKDRDWDDFLLRFVTLLRLRFLLWWDSGKGLVVLFWVIVIWGRKNNCLYSC